jgi:hypothetical protein
MIRHAALVFASALLVSGIAGANVAGHASHQTSGQRHGWMARYANPKHAWLYVAGYDNSAVFIYDLSVLGTPQIGEIAQGVDGPAGVTIDNQGTLYVVDQNANCVTLYPAGSTSPSLTLSAGLDFPNSAAVDASGAVYVTSRNSSPASIVVYPPGSSTPSGTITSPLIVDPLQDFFDAAGDLYFTDYSTGVNEIPTGSSQPVSVGLQGVPNPAGIVMDPSDGDLFVQNYAPGAYKTLVFAPGNVNASRTLKDNDAANLLALGKVRGHEYVFVPDFFSSRVDVFRHNARKPVAVINTAAENVNGVAFKPADVP